MSKQPEGYAPDLFSEHARAAQLGLRVREILRNAPALDGDGIEFRLGVRSDVALLVRQAARELGLVEGSAAK